LVGGIAKFGKNPRDSAETMNKKDRPLPLHNYEDKLDWVSLLDEFDSFELDGDSLEVDPSLFEMSLLTPAQKFVDAFIERKLKINGSRSEVIKILYYFLLKKRYEQRLNLLHFAFHIFDESTHLPEEVISQTPFPHEDGTPSFRHFNEPGFNMGPHRD